MPDISKELNDIMNARYGKDVRQSIHDGIEKVNNNLEDVGVDELLDVRKTAYNTILSTAGDSVRDQINYILDGLFSELFETGKNLFDKNRVINFGKGLTFDGEEFSSELLYYSHPIPVKPNTTYYMSKVIGSFVYPNAIIYDKDGLIIQTSPATTEAVFLTTLSNAAYMIVNGRLEDIDEFMVAESSLRVSYEPFKIKFKENLSYFDSFLKSNGDIDEFSSIEELPENGVYKLTADDIVEGLPETNVVATLIKISPTVPTSTGTGYSVYIYSVYGGKFYIGFGTGSSDNPTNWLDLSSNADLQIPTTINYIMKNLGNVNNKIILLGDSIVAGVGGSNFNGSSSGLVTPSDTSGGMIGTLGTHGTFYRNTKGVCWANYLKSYIESNYPNTQVINNGCSGINSKTVNDNFDTLVPSDATKIILCVGINDRHNGTSYTYTKNNIKGIIQKAKEKAIDIIVLTNINPLLSNDEQEIRNYNSYQVASAIKEACSEESVEVGNLQSELRYFLYLKDLELDSSLLPDGIHPNDTLYEYMYNVIKHILHV